MERLSKTSETPPAIQAAPTAASCRPILATWPVSVGVQL